MAERKTLNPKDQLNPLQRLLSSINIPGLPAQDGSKISPEQQKFLQQMIGLVNSPQDFAQKPGQAIGNTLYGAVNLFDRAVKGGVVAPINQVVQDATAPMMAAGPFLADIGQGMMSPGGGQSTTGQAQAAQDPMKQFMQDPTVKAAVNAAAKRVGQHATQAMDMGVSPQDIVNQAISQALLGQTMPQPQSGLSGANTGVLEALQRTADQTVAPQARDMQAQQTQQQDGPSVLRRLLSDFGEGFAQGVGLPSTLEKQKMSLENQKLQQEIALQPVKFQQELLKNAIDLDKEGRLKPNEIFGKFEDASKPFIEVRDGYSRMINAFPNMDFDNTNPAADLDLLFGTAKTLDPSGRVTDSDVAIQEIATGKFGDKMKKIARDFVKRGGILLPEERKFMFDAATKRYKAMENQQVKTTEEFSKLARNNGLDPENLIRNLGINLGESQQQTESPFVQTPGGNKFRRIK